jgi:hypothetical protein
VDPGIIVGYLVAKLMGRAGRFADHQVDRLLDRLYGAVWHRLGGDKALQRLVSDPSNDVAQDWARSSIENWARSDYQFREELTRLQRQLQQRAPDLLVYAPGAETVVGINQGYMIHGPVTIHQGPRDPNDWSDATATVKVLATLGIMLCLAGMGLFGWVFFSDQPGPGEPGFAETPEGFALAGGVFFAGFVLAAIASVAHGMRRRPRGPFG